MPKMSGAQALVRQLGSEGVTTIFGLPGVQIMAAFDALHEVQDDIRLIHTRHEQATTYYGPRLLQGHGQGGRCPGGPCGPGALNTAAGLGTAYACSSPVLLISGQIRSDALGKGQGQLHEVEDQLDVFKSITKWNSRVTRAEELPEAVHEAMHQLKTGRPRPVELEIPPDTLATTGDMEIIPSQEYPRSTAEPSDIQEAVQLLADASRELMALAEFIQAPVMTTPQAKEIIPEDHQLAVGAHYALVDPSKHVLPESDVILAVGTRLLVRDAQIKSSQKVIHIDIDAGVLGKNHKASIGIEADAREALSQLLQELQDASSPKPSRREEIAGYRRAFMEELRELAPQQVDIIGILRKRLDPNAIVVAGITNIGNWSHLAYPVSQPRTYVTSS